MSMPRITLHRALGMTLAGLLLLPLAACSGEDEVARDQPAPTGTASSDQDVEAEEPTSGPDVGFGPTDYAFTLQVSCFCPYAAVPVRVTVEDDRVVEAVFEKGGGRGGAKAGDPAPEFFELTIDDIIAEAEAAEEAGAARVDVTWPEGGDYPTEVYIDRDERMADEEIGYTLSDVKVVGEGIGG
ncbi:DUF6174 domain-containing protein [uncultured Nocardioides sp.]|jgi:hypothetical protein|uniref:DUF6174 domain-containing protein n=1 Tax=uncultured Nocardioides sp. TaxID=198441 RepID=UPI002629250D|nr:DUF6174 domain-containing protein [uncultured Nocardioides sp.]